MKIDGFEQKDSQGFENSYNSYEQYPLEKFLIFTIYQSYTLALIECFNLLLYAYWCKTSKCGQRGLIMHSFSEILWHIPQTFEYISCNLLFIL